MLTQILDAGFDSVEKFVEVVAKNYTTVRECKHRNGKETFLIEVADKYNNTLYIELYSDGAYWNVNSGGVFRKGYSKNKKIAPPYPK